MDISHEEINEILLNCNNTYNSEEIQNYTEVIENLKYNPNAFQFAYQNIISDPESILSQKSLAFLSLCCSANCHQDVNQLFKIIFITKQIPDSFVNVINISLLSSELFEKMSTFINENPEPHIFNLYVNMASKLLNVCPEYSYTIVSEIFSRLLEKPSLYATENIVGRAADVLNLHIQNLDSDPLELNFEQVFEVVQQNSLLIPLIDPALNYLLRITSDEENFHKFLIICADVIDYLLNSFFSQYEYVISRILKRLSHELPIDFYSDEETFNIYFDIIVKCISVQYENPEDAEELYFAELFNFDNNAIFLRPTARFSFFKCVVQCADSTLLLTKILEYDLGHHTLCLLQELLEQFKSNTQDVVECSLEILSNLDFNTLDDSSLFEVYYLLMLLSSHADLRSELNELVNFVNSEQENYSLKSKMIYTLFAKTMALSNIIDSKEDILQFLLDNIDASLDNYQVVLYLAEISKELELPQEIAILVISCIFSMLQNGEEIDDYLEILFSLTIKYGAFIDEREYLSNIECNLKLIIDKLYQLRALPAFAIVSGLLFSEIEDASLSAYYLMSRLFLISDEYFDLCFTSPRTAESLLVVSILRPERFSQTLVLQSDFEELGKPLWVEDGVSLAVFFLMNIFELIQLSLTDEKHFDIIDIGSLSIIASFLITVAPDLNPEIIHHACQIATQIAQYPSHESPSLFGFLILSASIALLSDQTLPTFIPVWEKLMSFSKYALCDFTRLILFRAFSKTESEPLRDIALRLSQDCLQFDLGEEEEEEEDEDEFYEFLLDFTKPSITGMDITGFTPRSDNYEI